MDFLAASETTVLHIRSSTLEAAIVRATGQLQSAFSICRRPQTKTEWYDMIGKIWAGKTEYLYHSVYLNEYITRNLLEHAHEQVSKFETVYEAAVRYAREAYRAHQKWLGAQDEWDRLPERARQAWIAAAEQVEHRTIREFEG